MIRKKTSANYLNNKDMLIEINKSKISYSEFIDPIYEQYDTIVNNVGGLINTSETPTTYRKTDQELYEFIMSPRNKVLESARRAKSDRLQVEKYEALRKYKDDKDIATKEFYVGPDDIPIEDLVFRVLTFEHIPVDYDRKKTYKSVADYHAKLNFTPFKHYIIRDNKLVEVGRSHWKNGEFSVSGGTITNKLAKMFMLLVNRYAEKSNWRGYSFVDEMKGQALLQLSHMSLQFEESKGSNPFSYFTAILTNSFTRVLNTEKRNRDLRDNILESYGQSPSLSRQLEHEEYVRQAREEL